MSIENIPTEILELIFGCLDGRSFIVCSQVCKRWKNVIEEMLRLKDWWKVFSFREIPDITLQELCGDNSVYKNSTHHHIIKRISWQRVYKQWFTCRIITLKPKVNTFASVESAPVTCCKLSGAWILTGHRNGSLCAWDHYDGDMIRIVTQHLRMVTDFVLVDLLGIGPYRCASHESLCGHQYAISVSKDHNVQISSLLEASYGLYFESQVIQQHADSLESVKLFGDRFAVLGVNNTISVWLLVPSENPSQLPKVKLQHFLTDSFEQVTWISFWNNQIGCLCNRGIFKEYNLETETWGKTFQPEDLCIGESVSDDYILVIRSAYLFWNSVIFLITADFHLLVSTCGSTYKVYSTMEKFHSYVLSLCFCGPLLALGLENGVLVLCYAEDHENLLDHSLQNPIWQKRLSPASIIAIDIMLQENGPVILAATAHSWITVDWSEVKGSFQRSCSKSSAQGLQLSQG